MKLRVLSCIISTALPLYAQLSHSEVKPAAKASAPQQQVSDAGDNSARDFREIIDFINRPTTDYNFTWRAGACSVFLKTHSDRLHELLSAAKPRNYADRNMMALALWLANTEQAMAEVRRQAQYNPLLGAPPLIGAGVRLDAPHPDFTRLENLHNGVEEANILDIAWGIYDMTGDAAILSAFIRCAARPAPPIEGAYQYWCIGKEGRIPFPETAAELDIVSMTAKWSILSRAEQSPDFNAELQRILLTLPEDVRTRFNTPLPDFEQNKHPYSAE